MSLIFYNAVIDSIVLISSDEDGLVTMYYGLMKNKKHLWIYLGEL